MFRSLCAALFLLGAVSVGQAAPADLKETVRVENIARIFMSTRTEFTLLVPDPKVPARLQLMPAPLCSEGRHCEVFFMPDVPAGEKMYFRCGRFLYSPQAVIETVRCEFHIHKAADIEGGGWYKREGDPRYSSPRTGMTNVIE